MVNSSLLLLKSQVEILFNYFNGVLFVFGTISDILIIIVCLRPKLRQVPTFVFKAFMAFVCLIELTFISFISFIKQIFDWQPEQHPSLVWCRVHAFFDCFSLQWLCWIVVFYSLEIYLNVKLPTFRKKFPVIKLAVYVSILLGVLMAILNLPAWFIQPSLSLHVSNLTEVICFVAEFNTDLNDFQYFTIVILNSFNMYIYYLFVD